MSDISQLLDQLNIDDHSVRNTIGDLIEVNKIISLFSNKFHSFVFKRVIFKDIGIFVNN